MQPSLAYSSTNACDLAELDNEGNYYSVTCCWVVLVCFQAGPAGRGAASARMEAPCTATVTWNLMDRTETFHSANFSAGFTKKKKKKLSGLRQIDLMQ